jgi:hypothetical protein
VAPVAPAPPAAAAACRDRARPAARRWRGQQGWVTARPTLTTSCLPARSPRWWAGRGFREPFSVVRWQRPRLCRRVGHGEPTRDVGQQGRRPRRSGCGPIHISPLTHLPRRHTRCRSAVDGRHVGRTVNPTSMRAQTACGVPVDSPKLTTYRAGLIAKASVDHGRQPGPRWPAALAAAALRPGRTAAVGLAVCGARRGRQAQLMTSLSLLGSRPFADICLPANDRQRWPYRGVGNASLGLADSHRSL